MPCFSLLLNIHADKASSLKVEDSTLGFNKKNVIPSVIRVKPLHQAGLIMVKKRIVLEFREEEKMQRLEKLDLYGKKTSFGERRWFEHSPVYRYSLQLAEPNIDHSCIKASDNDEYQTTSDRLHMIYSAASC